MRLQNKRSRLYDFVWYVRDRLSDVSGVRFDTGNYKRAIKSADIDGVLSEDSVRFLVAYFKDSSEYFNGDSFYLDSFCTNYYMSNVGSVHSLTKRMGVGSSVDDDYELIVVLLLIEILDYSYGIDDFDLSQDFRYY